MDAIRADVVAGAAVRAHLLVDDVNGLLSTFDGLDGALLQADLAADAVLRIDVVGGQFLGR